MTEFERRTPEQIRRITLERMRETTIAKVQEIEVFIEAQKNERKKVAGQDREIELVKALRQNEATLVQHEEDLKLIEKLLETYDKVEI